eukprot:scaffold38479_cov61-Phaeocystis_antarctica.AAC.1
MDDTQYILDLAAEKFTFVPDLASVLRLDPINPAVVFYLQAASLRQGTCLTLQVPGFQICTDQPKMASCPFIVSPVWPEPTTSSASASRATDPATTSTA